MAAATIDRGCSLGVDSRLRRPGFRRCERDRLESHLTDITHVIQLAVAPVFLLTAIATLINALNIRLGRGIDRRRLILGRVRATPGCAATTTEPSSGCWRGGYA